MSRLVALVCLLAVQDPTAPPAESRQVIVPDGGTVTVRLAVSDSSRNLVTAVTLPSPIANIVSAWDPKDLSVEHDGPRLLFKLLGSVEGYLDVTLAGGAHLRVRIRPAAGGFDSHVVVKLAARKVDTAAPPKPGALDLIRAMRLGEAPSWVTVARARGETLHESKGLKLMLLWTYSTDTLRGLIVAAANPSSSAELEVDVSRLQVEGLVLAGARDLRVPPGGSTRLYLVVANR